MDRPNAGRAIGAGFVATLVMTVLMYGGPIVRMPKMDIAAMLGSMLGQAMAAPGSGTWWIGMIMHFVNGTIIFPLIYAYALYAVLPGAPWVKGTTWGFVLWVIAQAIVMPVMGMGFFSSGAPQPIMAVAGSFIGHLIYGGILGGVTGRAAGDAQAVSRERRAA
jgi:uncharacterized membrane protein YagU involved in acid resistance